MAAQPEAALPLLPSELLLIVFHHLEPKSLKSLRLVCRTIADRAAPSLFPSIHLCPKDRSIQRLNFILGHERLVNYVKNLKLDASDGWDPTPPIPHHRRAQTKEYKRAAKALKYLQAIERLGNLSSLESVVMVYDEDFSGPGRNLVLLKFLRAVQASPLRSLTIKHLQHYRNFEELASSDALKSILNNLQELHIQFHRYAGCKFSGLPIRIPEQEVYYHNFCSTWLVPASKTLTHLSLYQERSWGVFANCLDGEDLLLPALTSLALGKYVFGQNRQLEWILNLKTLKRLVFVDSAIVCRFVLNGGRLRPGYLSKSDWVDRGYVGNGWHHYDFETTWATVFDRLRAELQLEAFGFGSTFTMPQTEFDVLGDYEGQATLSLWSYITFQPRRAVGAQRDYPDEDGIFSWHEEPFCDRYMETGKRDWEALRMLKEAVALRSSGRSTAQ